MGHEVTQLRGRNLTARLQQREGLGMIGERELVRTGIDNEAADRLQFLAREVKVLLDLGREAQFRFNRRERAAWECQQQVNLRAS